MAETVPGHPDTELISRIWYHARQASLRRKRKQAAWDDSYMAQLIQADLMRWPWVAKRRGFAKIFKLDKVSF